MCILTIVTRERLGRNVTAVTNTHTTIEEFLDASFQCGPCRIKESRRLVQPRTFIFFLFIFYLACFPSELNWKYGFYRQSVGLLGRVISPSQDRYLHRTTQTQNKRRQTSMPQVGFELTTPVFVRTKTFRALDSAASDRHLSNLIYLPACLCVLCIVLSVNEL
jgi:hypothetical protein